MGLRRSLTALREPDELACQGVPEVRRHSIATLLGVVDDLDRQLGPLDLELRPLARADRHAGLLATIPGVAELLGLTIASEIGEVSRFPSARRLVGYAGLVPRIKQSGQSSRVGRLSKAGADHPALGDRRGRPAGLAPEQSLAPALLRRQISPWQVQSRQGRGGPQGPDRRLARARPRTALHPPAPSARPIPPRQAPPLIWPPEAQERPEKPGQLQLEPVRRRKRRKRHQQPLPSRPAEEARLESAPT